MTEGCEFPDCPGGDDTDQLHPIDDDPDEESQQQQQWWCTSCVMRECDNLELVPPEDPPRWLYLAYPAETQADFFRSTANRLVTTDTYQLIAFPRERATTRLVYAYVRGRDWDSIRACNWNDILMEALRHGGPSEAHHYDDAFLSYLWNEHHDVRFRVRLIRASSRWSGESFSPSNYADEDDFLEAVHEYVPEGYEQRWFPCALQNDPYGSYCPPGCLIPDESSLYGWYSDPASMVHEWYTTLTQIELARWRPELREADEVHYVIKKTPQ